EGRRGRGAPTPRRGAGDRRGRGDSRRPPRPRVRPVRHDQASGPRPRPRHLPSDRRGAPGRPARDEHARQGHGLRLLPAHRRLPMTTKPRRSGGAGGPARSAPPRPVGGAWVGGCGGTQDERAASVHRGAPPPPLGWEGVGGCGGTRMTARILVADDEPSIRWLLERLLRQAGHTVTVVEDGETALARASTEAFDLAFLDVRMPGLDGLEVLSRLRTEVPETAVIVMTAHGSVRSAVEAMQRGAYDYLTKPFDNDEVRLLVERAQGARALAREVVELRTGRDEVWEFGALVGKSAKMQEVYKTIGRIAGTDVTVLLRGESGTGKEGG